MRPLTTLPLRSGWLLALATPFACHAINGAEPGGHGVDNAAMGGTSIALPLDAIAAANNPAGLSRVPDSVALDLQVFHGRSSADYVLPGNRLSNRQTVAAPEGGVVWHWTPAFTFGVSLASGGAGADYRQPALPVPGAANAKSSLKIAELIPAVAWQPADGLSIGAGLTLGHEQFEAEGVIVPAPVPGGLLPLPSHGTKSATGLGYRIGALWDPTPALSLGVNLKSRTHMGALSGYDQDLLAFSGGHLDLPSQAGIGLAWRATSRATLSADVLTIRWHELGVMQDPNGFRWRNQVIARVGGSWAVDDAWTLRAGYSRSNGQIDAAYATPNLLVPSINRQAVTAGVSWHVTPSSEATLGYELDPSTTLHGTGASAGTTLRSNVQMFLLGWQTRF